MIAVDIDKIVPLIIREHGYNFGSCVRSQNADNAVEVQRQRDKRNDGAD